jgi:hypothetical protein
MVCLTHSNPYCVLLPQMLRLTCTLRHFPSDCILEFFVIVCFTLYLCFSFEICVSFVFEDIKYISLSSCWIFFCPCTYNFYHKYYYYHHHHHHRHILEYVIKLIIFHYKSCFLTNPWLCTQGLGYEKWKWYLLFFTVTVIWLFVLTYTISNLF